MVIAAFELVDKLSRVQFFEDTFLFAKTSIKMVLGMFFLTISNMITQSAEKELVRRIYTLAKALPTTRKIELINMKDFAKRTLGKNIKTFVLTLSFLNIELMTIYQAQEA